MQNHVFCKIFCFCIWSAFGLHLVCIWSAFGTAGPKFLYCHLPSFSQSSIKGLNNSIDSLTST